MPMPRAHIVCAWRLSALVLTFLVATWTAPVAAQGPPGLPATFYGAVVIDGKPPPDGTQVRAFINGKECTQAGNAGTVLSGGIASYAITVPHESQVAGCGTEGATVSFAVGGQPASQTATWTARTQQVGLSVGSATPPTLPSPTPTATSNPTQAVATATAQAVFTPLPAPSVLPTDEPIFPSGTKVPTAPGVSGAGDQGSDGGDGGGSLAAPLLVVLGLLGVAGIAGGVAIARRRRPAA